MRISRLHINHFYYNKLFDIRVGEHAVITADNERVDFSAATSCNVRMDCAIAILSRFAI